MDPERFAMRLGAMLDGFGTPLVIGLPGITRDLALEHIGDYLDEVLHLHG